MFLERCNETGASERVVIMVVVLQLGLKPDHSDYPSLKAIEEQIIEKAGGWERFKRDIPLLLRQGIDEVIDSARSKRFLLEELEKTEKTYIGTKIEILLRNHLQLERGKVLDVVIGETEVDIKNTVGRTWTIPLEALGHPCILIKEDEVRGECSFGLMIATANRLMPGKNRDRKSGIAAHAMVDVHWMLRRFPYPMNFWQQLPPDTRLRIMASYNDTQRLVTLFTELQERPIGRKVIQAVAPQLDPMKRLRKNGGARDFLSRQGIVLLTGSAHRKLIQELGLPACKSDEAISFRPTDHQVIERLRELQIL
jgi:hypothetical protein